MKYYYTTLLAIFLTFPSLAQLNMSLVGQLPYQDSTGFVRELSDIWGYEDENGNEYALVGVFDGFSVVDCSDPANPVEVFFESGPQSTWRDVKVWNDHAYVTTEGGAGLLIVDLSPLPQSSNLTVTYFTGNE